LVFGTESTIEITPKEIKPYKSEGDFTIGHSLASSTGTKEVEYFYSIKINEKEISLNKLEDIDLPQSSIGKKIALSEINKLLTDENLNLDKNSTYESQVIIKANDGFTTTFIVENIIIDYIEPPTFKAETFPRIFHDFDTKIGK